MEAIVDINDNEFVVFFKKRYTGGYGGGPDFPTGEYAGEMYDYDIVEVLDSKGNVIKVDNDLEQTLVQEIMWQGF